WGAVRGVVAEVVRLPLPPTTIKGWRPTWGYRCRALRSVKQDEAPAPFRLRREITPADWHARNSQPRLDTSRRVSSLQQSWGGAMKLTRTANAGRVFLGNYEAQHLLGEGGMGKAYLGRQCHTGQVVVIKVLRDELAADPRFRQSFDRETRLMMRFRHPHAVALLDAGHDHQ